MKTPLFVEKAHKTWMKYSELEPFPGLENYANEITAIISGVPRGAIIRRYAARPAVFIPGHMLAPFWLVQDVPDWGDLTCKSWRISPVETGEIEAEIRRIKKEITL